MHNIWKDMFVIGLPLAEKILRPIIVYAFLVISLRLSGKRELVQLNPFDLVVLLTLSNTVQNAIIGEDNSVLGGRLEGMARDVALLRGSQPRARAWPLRQVDALAHSSTRVFRDESAESEEVT